MGPGATRVVGVGPGPGAGGLVCDMAGDTRNATYKAAANTDGSDLKLAIVCSFFHGPFFVAGGKKNIGIKGQTPTAFCEVGTVSIKGRRLERPAVLLIAGMCMGRQTRDADSPGPYPNVEAPARDGLLAMGLQCSFRSQTQQPDGTFEVACFLDAATALHDACWAAQREWTRAGASPLMGGYFLLRPDLPTFWRYGELPACQMATAAGGNPVRLAAFFFLIPGSKARMTPADTTLAHRERK
jgi:hypothetical protein